MPLQTIPTLETAKKERDVHRNLLQKSVTDRWCVLPHTSYWLESCVILFSRALHTLHKKVKDICQYLDLNTKIKANSLHCTKHLENFKISLTFLCSVASEDPAQV